MPAVSDYLEREHIMAVSGEALMGQLRVALIMQRVGGTASADNEAEGWRLSSQVSRGQVTGKVVVRCNNSAALADFTRLANAEGHTVEKVRLKRGTVLITPATS